VGDENVIASDATRKGLPLSPHDPFDISNCNAADIWLDVEEANEYISGIVVIE